VSELFFPLVEVPASAQSASLIRSSLSKNMDFGRSVCACCLGSGDSLIESGAGFQLPARWELLYSSVNLPTRRRVIIALGFNIPKQQKSTNNMTTEGALDVIRAYQVERDHQLSLGSDLKTASVAARDFMRSHEYSGRKLGTPSYKHDMWLQCGVLESETEVPQEYRRDFCGLWFHSSCIGVL
jgi:hypothetical protein